MTAAPPTSELAAFLTRMLDADEAAARAAIEHRVNTGSYQVSGAYLTHGQRAGATWRATYDEVYERLRWSALPRRRHVPPSRRDLHDLRCASAAG